MTGFLEESPGERSMTRLAVLILVCAIVLLCLAIAVVAVVRAESAPAIIAAIGVAIGTLAGGVWGALRERR